MLYVAKVKELNEILTGTKQMTGLLMNSDTLDRDMLYCMGTNNISRFKQSRYAQNI